MKMIATLALLLAGCAGAQVQPGPAPAPNPVLPEYRVVIHASGSGDIQSFISAVPASAFFRWQGNGTLTALVNVAGVTLYLDGDSTWTVTPAPGLEREAQAAIEAGIVVIRRNGQPAAMSWPASRVPQAPEPTPLPKSPEPPVAEVEGECHDECCRK